MTDRKVLENGDQGGVMGASSPSAPTALAPLRGQAPSGLEQSRSSTGAALIALAERVEALEGPDRALDADIHRALFGTIMISPCKVPLFRTAVPTNTALPGPYHFTGHVEEAEIALPDDGGWPEWQITRRFCTGYHASVGTGHDGVGCEAPALALCSAGLRARAASVGRNAKRHDPAEGRGPQDEHAVGEAETPNSPSDHPGERA